MLSIICAARNEERHIGACVESVQKQTSPDWEFLFVDDRSTDATLSIVSDWAKVDSRVRVVESTEPGKIAAFNAGVAAARGEWIHLIGADDMLVPDAVGSLLQTVHALTPQHSAVYHDLLIVSEATGQPLFYDRFDRWLADTPLEQVLRQKRTIAGGGCFAIRRTVAQSVVWPQPVDWKNEDAALGLVLRLCGKVEYWPAAPYLYRQRARRTTEKPTAENHRNRAVEMGEAFELFADRALPSIALPPEVTVEMGRYVRYGRLHRDMKWTLSALWQGRVGWRRFLYSVAWRTLPCALPAVTLALRRWRKVVKKERWAGNP